MLTALLVCLIPTTIGALLSAIGIAGMDRLVQRNVLATSGRAVEAAGDVDTLLLDKTGTITFGNRQATALHPGARRRARPSWPRPPGCPAWPTRPRRAAASSSCAPPSTAFRPRRPRTEATAEFVPFTAQTRMSGLDLDGRAVRKGAGSAVAAWLRARATCPTEVSSDRRPDRRRRAARRWSSPSGRAGSARVLGVVQLSDVVKPGMRERFAELRAMGIRTVMITGDNPLHREGDRRARPASTTSSPRPRPRTRWR